MISFLCVCPKYLGMVFVISNLYGKIKKLTANWAHTKKIIYWKEINYLRQIMTTSNVMLCYKNKALFWKRSKLQQQSKYLNHMTRTMMVMMTLLRYFSVSQLPVLICTCKHGFIPPLLEKVSCIFCRMLFE